MPPLAITVTDSGIDLSLSPGTALHNVSHDVALPRVRVATFPHKTRSRVLATGRPRVPRVKKSVRFASNMVETHVVPSIWALCETNPSPSEAQHPSHAAVVQYYSALEQRAEILKQKKRDMEAAEAVPALRESSFASMWFCASELQEIKQNCYRTIAFALSNAVGDFEETKENTLDRYNSSLPLPPLPPGATEPPCLRGLEHKTPKAAMRRLQVKRSSWAAVLDEQDRQWAIGVDFNDPERIGEIYRQYCANSAKRARDMGRRDAKEARRIWEVRGEDPPQRITPVQYALADEDDSLYDASDDKYAFAAPTSRKPRTIQNLYFRSQQRLI